MIRARQLPSSIFLLAFETMSRFNIATSPTKTVNLAGGEAYTENPKLAFASLLLTSFVKDQFYKSEDQTITDVANLISQIPDKKFLAKTAIYARTKFGMRSISHMVAGELAPYLVNTDWGKNFFDKVVFRPDDITEIMAYYQAKALKKQTHAMRKGFASAMRRFDVYKLAKYKKEGSQLVGRCEFSSPCIY